MANLEQLPFVDEPALAVAMETEYAAVTESLVEPDQPLFQRTMADGSIETANSVEDVLAKCDKMRQLFKDHPDMALTLINMAAVTPKPENNKPKDNRDKNQAAKVEPPVKEVAHENKLKTEVGPKLPAELNDQSTRTRTEAAILQNELAKAKFLSEAKDTVAPVVKPVIVKKSSSGKITNDAINKKVVATRTKPVQTSIPRPREVLPAADVKTSPLLELTAPIKEAVKADLTLNDGDAIETVIAPALDTVSFEPAPAELPVIPFDSEPPLTAETNESVAFDYLLEPTELIDNDELQFFYDQLEDSVADATSVSEAVALYEEQLAQDTNTTFEPNPLDEIALENLVTEFTGPDLLPEAKLATIDPTETYELAALIMASLPEQTVDTEVTDEPMLPVAVIERIEALLFRLGYRNPAQVLEDYLDNHTPFELAEQLQAVADMQDHAFRMEFMRSLRTTFPKTDNIKQRFAQLLVFLMSRPTIAA